jgi:uncharacterized protein YceK
MKQCAVLLLLTTIIIFSGCNDVIHQRQNSSLQQFMEEPITISWDGDIKDGVQSY